MLFANGPHTESRSTLEDLYLTSLLTMSSRSGILTSAFTKGILSTSSGKGLCFTLYLIPTALLGVGRPSGTNTCCVERRKQARNSCQWPRSRDKVDPEQDEWHPSYLGWRFPMMQQLTAWSHPLISSGTSGLVDELHGPGVAPSRPSDQNGHRWTGVWDSRRENTHQDKRLQVKFIPAIKMEIKEGKLYILYLHAAKPSVTGSGH